MRRYIIKENLTMFKTFDTSSEALPLKPSNFCGKFRDIPKTAGNWRQEMESGWSLKQREMSVKGNLAGSVSSADIQSLCGPLSAPSLQSDLDNKSYLYQFDSRRGESNRTFEEEQPSKCQICHYLIPFRCYQFGEPHSGVEMVGRSQERPKGRNRWGFRWKTTNVNRFLMYSLIIYHHLLSVQLPAKQTSSANWISRSKLTGVIMSMKKNYIQTNVQSTPQTDNKQIGERGVFETARRTKASAVNQGSAATQFVPK